MNEFKELGINEKLLQILDKEGITTPTQIQKKSISLVLEGKDVIAGSETGSGKTLAFGLAMIQNIEQGKGIQGLVVTPTRELAEQIYQVFRTYSAYKRLNIAVIYGGVSYNPQFAALSKADIVIGTPGRLLDHLERGSLNLSNIKHLVFDEGDRMFDMGFLPDVTKILRQCPQQRQMMLFSATIHPDIVKLTKQFMHDPVRVSAGQYVDPKKMAQYYYDVHSSMKFSLLVHLLSQETTGLVMVFCNSRRYTDIVAKNLAKQGLDAMAIHGGLTQFNRSKILTRFQSGDAFILVCTDVAARGLDIPDVSHVYNYDMPDDPKQYIHRIGRTARAGESGKIVNLISYKDFDNFGRVLHENHIEVKKVPIPEDVKKIEIAQERNRSQGQRRSSGGGRGRSGPQRGGQSGNHGGGKPRQGQPPKKYFKRRQV